MRATIIKIASILATSFEVPNMSPVAHLKFFCATNATINPDISPALIPIIPVVLNIRYPNADARINDSNNIFLFIESMNDLPVPSGNGFEKVAQVTIPILAAISEITST